MAKKNQPVAVEIEQNGDSIRRSATDRVPEAIIRDALIDWYGRQGMEVTRDDIEFQMDPEAGILWAAVEIHDQQFTPRRRRRKKMADATE